MEVGEDWRDKGSSLLAPPFDPTKEGVRGRLGPVKKPFNVDIGSFGDAEEEGVCVFV